MSFFLWMVIKSMKTPSLKIQGRSLRLRERLGAFWLRG